MKMPKVSRHFELQAFCETPKSDAPNIFTLQPLKSVWVLLLSTVSRWAGGQREKICSVCISETARCRKLMRGRDIGWGLWVCKVIM